MSENKKNIPKRRFKEFENAEAWEQRKLRDVLINRRILQRQSENAPRLAFASGQGVIKLSERKTNNRDQLIADEFSKNYLLTEYNDIVYNPANLKYGAIDRNKLGRGVISPIYVTFTTEEIPAFVERIVTTEKFKLKALQFEEGTVVKRQSVSPENLLSFDEMFAPTKEEQQKIGEFFDYLDNLITLHQRKLEKMKALKKAYLTEMFPAEGERKPKLRFDGFTDDWEQRKLGEDVADIVGGGTPSTSIDEYWNGEIDWYSPTEIGENVYANGSEKTITELGLQKSSAKILPAKKTVLFTSRAGIGDMAILQRSGATNQGFQSLVLKEGYDTYFIYSEGHLIKKYAEKHASGSTFLEISGKLLGQMEIMVPSEQEQKKIGELFRQIDNLIAIHQRKLEKLQNIKKAYLNEMFI